MKKLLLIVMASTVLGSVALAQSKEEKKISAAVDALRQAMLDANQAALDELTSPALTYGHSSGKMEDKAAFIQALVSGNSDFLTMDLTQQTILIQGKTAIVRHNLAAETNDNGKAGTVKLGVMLVWQKDGGKWKLLGRQAFRL
jgi:hypothetical protein